MRTAEGSKAALGGTYPATSLYMPTDYVNAHKDTVQKLVNAYVVDAEVDPGPHRRPDRRQDAGRLLQGRRQGGLRQGARQREGHLQPDRHHAGRRAARPAWRCSASSTPRCKGKTIDLAKTYTNEFVKAATPVS